MVVLTVLLFCGVSTEASFPLLRIGTSQPQAHQASARLCFFYRPKVAFFSPVYSQFNGRRGCLEHCTRGEYGAHAHRCGGLLSSRPLSPCPYNAAVPKGPAFSFLNSYCNKNRHFNNKSKSRAVLKK